MAHHTIINVTRLIRSSMSNGDSRGNFTRIKTTRLKTFLRIHPSIFTCERIISLQINPMSRVFRECARAMSSSKSCNMHTSSKKTIQTICICDTLRIVSHIVQCSSHSISSETTVNKMTHSCTITRFEQIRAVSRNHICNGSDSATTIFHTPSIASRKISNGRICLTVVLSMTNSISIVRIRRLLI